ncbi:hypothetical protein sS8_0760 [Methylocaldum marinum]|uniref:Uncharacterized protein n=1 Tax=Methylocaldum marinum TaxID=1432792 RepID=A0A250KM77_9GAMM|nr:hypothetical protein [Methylocaldum marinum]BBA32725.1 hypothetical protein sS8_0760 [Methylocaldum marinum]
MALRKRRLCHHPELIQRLLDAADVIYLDPHADRAKLNRVLDLVERLQRRNPLTAPPRHFHHGVARPRGPSMAAKDGNCSETVLSGQPAEPVARRKRAL